MATQIVLSPERPRPQAVRMNFRKAGSRFFAPAMELLKLYFGSPKRLDYLDAQSRATLPTHKRTALDADLSVLLTIC